MLTSRIEYFDELIKVSKVIQENIIDKIKILEQEIGLLRLDNGNCFFFLKFPKNFF